MTFPVPYFVRIEYWNGEAGEWHVGHAAHNLMDPQKYATKLGQGQPNRYGEMTKPPRITRIIDKDTEQVWYSEGADLL